MLIDAFGEDGRSAVSSECSVPPNATLHITLELVSWKSVSDVSKDKKVIKKILKEGEGYERPDDGTVVQSKMAWNSTFIVVYNCVNGFLNVFLIVLCPLCQ